nr:PREDICTED: splicing factor 3B subunit 2-like [Anolis carolinensis]|eukprot:XP_016853936.1 PREDICTED: splicing factor 3B subunit 2-like [Anolis carolinensis]
MATEVHPEAPKAGELPLPGYAAWSPNELQAKLAEIGAPTQGSREELVERLKTYTLQTGIVLNRPVLRGDDGDKLTPPPMPVQVSSLYPKGSFVPIVKLNVFEVDHNIVESHLSKLICACPCRLLQWSCAPRPIPPPDMGLNFPHGSGAPSFDPRHGASSAPYAGDGSLRAA